jgi:hypothetical protein
MKIELKCKNCENNFETEFKFRDKKFCSRKCYFQYANKNNLIGRKKDVNLREVRNCLICNGEFEVKKTDKKRLCSDECRKKWGQIEENKEKRILATKKSLYDKYGVDSIFKTNEFKKNLKNIYINKYGVDSPMKNKKILDKLKNTIREKHVSKLIEKLEDNNIKLLDDYTKNKNGSTSLPYNFKCLKCDNEFSSTLLGCGKIPICRKCFPVIKNSKLEESIRDFLNDKNIKHLDNSRKLLNGKEIDLFLQEKNLGIEINGNFYHSEIHGEKDKNYHIDKTNLAFKSNIKLIHIFEDELLYKRDIVFSRLSNILGLNTNKIFARKCIVKEINKKESNIFLEKNHIQGSSIDKIRLGLYYNNELVSVMTFGSLRKATGNKNKINQYELLRFANILNFNIVGGFSKLLKNFIKIYKPTKIVTYADIRWSGLDYKDTVYHKNDFKYIYTTKPNYWYLKINEFNNRYHRFNFRKDVLIKEGYDEKLSEFEIMKIKGYDRIWDCGNMKFEFNIMNTGASFDNI